MAQLIMWRGLVPTLGRAFVVNGIIFAVYDSCLDMLKQI
jgi:hypothetical protein